MRQLALTLALLLASGALASGASLAPPRTPEARWATPGGEPVEEVAGYRVVDYRDAGEGGGDWALVGQGRAGGNGTRHLFMVEGPLAARVALSVPSEAVAFMMDGDSNEGFATFLVDGQEVGTWDMYNRSMQTLVVTDLPMRPHTLEVRMTGRKRPTSRGVHVSLYGGSALVREVIAAR